jgi:hypothetical protein
LQKLDETGRGKMKNENEIIFGVDLCALEE